MNKLGHPWMSPAESHSKQIVQYSVFFPQNSILNKLFTLGFKGKCLGVPKLIYTTVCKLVNVATTVFMQYCNVTSSLKCIYLYPKINFKSQ